MNYQQKLSQRLDELLELGERVAETSRRPPIGVLTTANFVDSSIFYEWKTASLSFLKSVFGEMDVHYKQFEENCTIPRSSDSVPGQAVLRAAKSAIDGGHLKRIEDLVSADVFTDFLDMATYLLENGYKDPAASLIGAVLEDGLRRLVARHEITLKAREGISSLNKKLADADMYNRLVQKQVEVWNELRNNADHGHFDGYEESDVRSMLAGVQSFLADRL